MAAPPVHLSPDDEDDEIEEIDRALALAWKGKYFTGIARTKKLSHVTVPATLVIFS